MDWSGDESVYIGFKYKVTYSGKSYHSHMNFLGGSHIYAGKNCCFFGTVGFIKGVVLVFTNVLCLFP